MFIDLQKHLIVKRPWIRCMNNLNEDMLIHPNQQLMIPIVYQKVNPLPQPYQRQSYDLYF